MCSSSGLRNGLTAPVVAYYTTLLCGLSTGQGRSPCQTARLRWAVHWRLHCSLRRALMLRKACGRPVTERPGPAVVPRPLRLTRTHELVVSSELIRMVNTEWSTRSPRRTKTRLQRHPVPRGWSAPPVGTIVGSARQARYEKHRLGPPDSVAETAAGEPDWASFRPSGQRADRSTRRCEIAHLAGRALPVPTCDTAQRQGIDA